MSETSAASAASTAKKPLFDRHSLTALIIPLIIEQFLAMLIGAADTIMVSSCGEAAVSGVSLVDTINILLIQVFSALATGGAVVAAQYLGMGKKEDAKESSKQLMIVVLVVSLIVTILSLITHRPLLRVIFGSIDNEVMANAQIYFLLSALSYPFLSLYNGGAALFRSMGNSKISMITSFFMNGLNIVGNAILIYGAGWAVFGAALATLISRILGAIYMIWLLLKKDNPLSISGILHTRLSWKMVRSILVIGVPNGIENGLFQVGKILVASLISSFGTYAITANAVSNTLAGLEIVPSSAIGLAMITVVGQCIGAGDDKQTAEYTKKLMVLSYIAMLICNLLMTFGCPLLISFYNTSAETAQIAKELVWIHSLMGIIFWPASFTLPNALRAAGDAKFTMIISMLSMWLCRIGMSFLLGVYFNMGVQGVWIAMTIDWIFRAALYIWRFARGGWKGKKVVS
ncbi:MAG: MATE family efflux transporter [Oscillospiraceae bacterium]|nr:MATE family efflux transporter [Oscillospiraceae bacterium]